MALGVAMAMACQHQRAFHDLPRASDGRAAAIFTLRSSECDGNLAALTLFDLPRVRAGLALAAVALVDGDSAEPRLRAQMRAYDVSAPVVRLSIATRDSIARLTEGLGPSILVFERERGQLLVMPAPHTSRQLAMLADTLASIASRASRAGVAR